MNRLLALILPLAFSVACGALEFSWKHDGKATDNTDLPPGEIAFQLVYRVGTVDPWIVDDIAEGALASAGAYVTHPVTLTVTCGDAVYARVRAKFKDNWSVWEPPNPQYTQFTHLDCMIGPPEEFILE